MPAASTVVGSSPAAPRTAGLRRGRDRPAPPDRSRARASGSRRAPRSISVPDAAQQVGMPPELRCDPLGRELELDPQRDEPLLRPVVQVALDPPPLVVGAALVPRPRLAHLAQQRGRLHGQPMVLERHHARTTSRCRRTPARESTRRRGRSQRCGRSRSRTSVRRAPASPGGSTTGPPSASTQPPPPSQ